MEPNSKTRYEILTGTVVEITEQLNECPENWKPVLMSALSTNTLAVLMEIRRQK
jgi:hypothetical protein